MIKSVTSTFESQEVKPVLPELQIWINNRVNEAVSHSQKNIVEDALRSAVSNRDAAMVEKLESYGKSKMDAVTDLVIQKAAADRIAQLVSDTQRTLRAHDDRLKDLCKITMPDYYIAIINDLTKRVSNMDGEIKTLANRFNEYILKKTIEIVTDKEIKSLYIQSGLQFKHVAERFNVEQPRAYKMVHGEIADHLVRHQLKQFLISVIEKSKKES